MKRILDIISTSLSSLAGKNINYYESNRPALDLKYFFTGDIEGWGAVFDYRGRQVRSFHILIIGEWSNNRGILREYFTFNDETKLERTWLVEFLDNHLFMGNTEDVVGYSQGQQKGNAANTQYVLRVPYNNFTIDLKMDDWMYLIDGQTIINRTTMHKFGFSVGESILFLKKKK